MIAVLAVLTLLMRVVMLVVLIGGAAAAAFLVWDVLVGPSARAASAESGEAMK